MDMFSKNVVYYAGYSNGYYLEYGISTVSYEDAEKKARDLCWEKTIADNPSYWKGFVNGSFE